MLRSTSTRSSPGRCAHRDRFPVDVEPRRREDAAARAGPRHQGGRAHPRDAPRDRDPRRRSGAAARAPRTRCCRSSSSATTGPRRICLDERTAERTVQAEGDATGIWLLMHVHARLEQRNRFRRLAQSRATSRLHRRDRPTVDLDRAGRRSRSCSTPRLAVSAAGGWRTAPSTCRRNSSIWPRPRSCIAIPSASRSSIACCGGCADNHDLLEVATDPDVAQVTAMAKAVRRDEHKMHAFVRFREIGREQQVALRRLVRAGASHRRARRAVLRQRFADMPWSILTPDLCAHWDGHALSFTSGVSQEPRRRPKTGWRKPGGATTPASSIRRG